MSTLIQASCYRQHRKLCALPRCKDRVQITKHQSTVLTQIPHISNDPWQGFERGETRAAIAKQGLNSTSAYMAVAAARQVEKTA